MRRLCAYADRRKEFMNCTCPVLFTEESFLCSACETAELAALVAMDADKIPTGDAWDEYARRQG